MKTFKTLKKFILLLLAAFSLFATAQVPILSMKPVASKAGTLYSYIPNTAAGDFDVVRNGINQRINQQLQLENVAVNVPQINWVDGVPVLVTQEAATALIADNVSFGKASWTKSGATIEGDPSSAGSDLNVSSCANGDYGTFTGASATGFTAVSDGAATHEAGTADEIVFPLNQMVKVTFSLTLTSGTAPNVTIKTALAGTNIANAKTFVPVAGTIQLIFLYQQQVQD